MYTGLPPAVLNAPGSSFSNLTLYNLNTNSDQTADKVSELPTEVGMMIFGFVGLRELSMASLTCKTWRVLAVNELVSRGKNKWRLVDALIRSGAVNHAFKIADSLPFCDPVFVSLFRGADTKNDFSLSLKIASYKDYNPRLIGQLAHCFYRNEKANWSILIAWINGLNMNNENHVLTARHLIGVIIRNMSLVGRNDIINKLVDVVAKKDATLVDRAELERVNQLMLAQGNFSGLLDLGVCSSQVGDSSPIIADSFCQIPTRSIQLEQWITVTVHEPTCVSTLLMRVANCLFFKNKLNELSNFMDLLIRLKLQLAASSPFRKIDNQFFWNVAIGQSVQNFVFAGIIINKLSHLHAWEEAKLVVSGSRLSIQNKAFLIEKIELDQALVISELEVESVKEQQRIQSNYRDMQQSKTKTSSRYYNDDEEEEFMAYLTQE